jgi:MATE family multidrug resistance protein
MNKFEIKKILDIAIPSLIAWIGHAMYSIVDNVMVSKILGSKALAITGMATAFYFILLVFGIGASSIIVALVSESFAKDGYKKERPLAKIVQNSLLFCFIMGVATSLVLAFAMEAIIPLINKQSHLNEDIKSFLAILIPGPTFIIVFFGLERVCEGVNRARFSMYSVLICNVINAILNYCFLTGSFGFPNLGVNGASFASVSASFFEVVFILTFIYRDKITREAMRFKVKYFSKKEFVKIAKLGLPGGFVTFSESVAFNITGFFASKVSVYDVASHQLLVWGVNTLIAPIFGLAFAVTARIAYNVAEGKDELAFKIGVYSIFSTLIYTIFVLGLFNFFKMPLISSAFKGGEEDLITIGLMISAFSVVFFAEIVDGIQIIVGAILRGYKDTKIHMFFAVISYWGFCVPLSYYFGVIKLYGISGIWFGIGVGLFIQAVLTLLRFYFKFKPRKLHLKLGYGKLN